MKAKAAEKQQRNSLSDTVATVIEKAEDQAKQAVAGARETLEETSSQIGAAAHDTAEQAAETARQAATRVSGGKGWLIAAAIAVAVVLGLVVARQRESGFPTSA